MSQTGSDKNPHQTDRENNSASTGSLETRKNQISPRIPDSAIKNVFELDALLDHHGEYTTETLDALKAVGLQALEETKDVQTSTIGNSVPHSLSPKPHPNPTVSHYQPSERLFQIAYNPNEKAKRLGRPRRHIGATSAVPSEETAVKNSETSKLLKFRLDDMPPEGPGSRGGSPEDKKRAGNLSEPSAVKKRKQSVLNFAVADAPNTVGLEVSLKAPESENAAVESVSEAVKTEETPVAASSEASNGKSEAEPGTPVKSETATSEIASVPPSEPDTAQPDEASVVSEEIVEIPPEQGSNGTAKTKTKAKPKPKAEPAPKTKHVTLRFRNKITKTSIVRERNRVTRTYPGPLVALHYDIYDDNLFEAKENATVVHERIAFGFDVKPSPHSADIIFIMAFLAKFPEIIYVGHIGPQDIEYGLGLARDPDSEEPGVSRLMDDLFCKLLTLLLNRKKIITPGNYKSGIQELRQSYISLGLPQEWRDDTYIRVVTTVPTDMKADHVDPTKPPVPQEDNCEYSAPSEKLNPMHEKAFEEQGLAGIANPVDRLIMMRCLVLWSLSGSNVLKTHLAQIVNKQEIAGEKDTIYASRPILKGFAQTIELKKDLEAKIYKKGKVTASPQGTPDPDSSQRYIDPTSDPIVHPMALRLNEFIVGDCGFNVGRFYLVRMADPAGGGISSVDKMKAVAKDPTGIKLSIPSRFKLYVEDVHSVLLESLRVHGPEFDKEGKEVPNSSTYDDSKHWYEVASNAAELTAFTRHLAQKLGLGAFASEDTPRLSQNSVAYKPTLYMYQYLSLVAPLMESFEKMEQSSGSAGSRTSRKKVDYNVEKSLHNFEDGYDEHLRDDGDDSYDEGEGSEVDDEEYSE